MPVNFLAEIFYHGPSSIPYFWPVLKATGLTLFIAVLKLYFGGASNTSERNMHSKVVLMTVSHARDAHRLC